MLGFDGVMSKTLYCVEQVSSLFKDGTIGTDINIVVVSLLLLEKDPVRFKFTLIELSRCFYIQSDMQCYLSLVATMMHNFPKLHIKYFI